MGLQKSIVSPRTGITLTYHEVVAVDFSGAAASIMVASYPDKAAKDAGKHFADVRPVTTTYDGGVLPTGVFAWAQGVVAATSDFAGATIV